MDFMLWPYDVCRSENAKWHIIKIMKLFMSCGCKVKIMHVVCSENETNIS